MLRKSQVFRVFLLAIFTLAALFRLSLFFAGWPNVFSWIMTALFVILLRVSADDYFERFFLQQDDYVRAKHPDQERTACRKIINVFAVALLAAWIGYGATALFFSHCNPFLRIILGKESTARASMPSSPRRLKPAYSDHLDLLAIYPPELPGVIGMARYIIALLSGMAAWAIVVEISIPKRIVPKETPFNRGRWIISLALAQMYAKRLLPQNDEGVPWGGVQLPTDATKTHLLVIGSPGSGKTLIIRILLGVLLPRIVFGHDRRALVYDSKRELFSYIANMRLRCPVKLINPPDIRSAAWDIAKDCTDPATAVEIAAILFPSGGESQPYFINAARDILSGVLIAFHILCPGRWTFRDVVLAQENPDVLRWLFDLHPETRNRLNYFSRNASFLDILTTISTRNAFFRPIAAAWSHATEAISLRDWANGAFVLVVSTDETMRHSLDAINQVIFKRASELLLAQNESSTRESHIVLDELREAGKLPGLSSLLTRGRSFGIRILAGFQDISGLRDVYGPDVANEIAGLFSNKAFLRLDDSETALWASRHFGDVEFYETHTSTTTNDTDGQTTTSETKTKQLVKRDVVLPSEFTALPPTNRLYGLTGYFFSPLTGGYKPTLTSEYLDQALTPSDPNVPNFIQRPVEHFYLKPWTDADRRRLNLDKIAANPSPTTTNNLLIANDPPPVIPPTLPDLQSVRRVNRHLQE